MSRLSAGGPDQRSERRGQSSGVPHQRHQGRFRQTSRRPQHAAAEELCQGETRIPKSQEEHQCSATGNSWLLTWGWGHAVWWEGGLRCCLTIRGVLRLEHTDTLMEHILRKGECLVDPHTLVILSFVVCCERKYYIDLKIVVFLLLRKNPLTSP